MGLIKREQRLNLVPSGSAGPITRASIAMQLMTLYILYLVLQFTKKIKIKLRWTERAQAGVAYHVTGRNEHRMKLCRTKFYHRN